MACDEGVVRQTKAPRAYAACLTSLAERSLERRAHALSLGVFERRPELVYRVHSVLWGKQALQPLAARALVGVVGCGLLFGSVELARCPQIVAFVTVRKPDVQTLALAPANTRTVLADRASFAANASPRLTGAATEFRAIETKAILPASRGVRAPLVSASPRRATGPSAQPAQPAGAAEIEIASREANAAPRAEMTIAQLPASQATQATPPEYVVFTAWEVTRTSTQQARAVADYDTGAAAEQQGSAFKSRQASEPATQITVMRQIRVMRLILAVYPADSAPSPNAVHATGSNSDPPAAPPVDSGWVVFQL
jgi:hypothetical protein